MIKKFQNHSPKIHETVFVADSADIIGDVEIGCDSSVWFQCVIRGDVHWIKIGEKTNIQDGTVIHVTEKTCPTRIGNRVTVGHKVMIHGCTIGDDCLIGMGAIILDGAKIGARSIVAAGSVVAEGFQGEPEQVLMGIPAKPVRKIRPSDIPRIEEGWKHYLETKEEYLNIEHSTLNAEIKKTV